jgi:hypothetical protein
VADKQRAQAFLKVTAGHHRANLVGNTMQALAAHSYRNTFNHTRDNRIMGSL